MIVNFVFPSSHHRTAGVVVLYEIANGLARRGHEVHFSHGPWWAERINSVDEIAHFTFEPSVHHHIVDTDADPSIPDGDVVFHAPAISRLGQRAVIVQGYRMFKEEVERQTFRYPMPKVCVASWLVDVALRYGVPREQCWYVPLGLDHDTFALRTPLDERTIDVAMLSHPHREKGYPTGVQALEELRRRMPNARVVVFGMDPPRRLPVGAEFRQAPSHRELADEIYNQSRVFVQPSFHEGFGYTALEAMACGSALVSTNNGGSHDYAFANETAIVVEPGDWHGLADGIEMLLRDDDRRARLAAAGVRHVRGFNWEHTAELLESNLVRYLADPAALQHEPADDEFDARVKAEAGEAR